MAHLLASLINHVALPPKLPASADENDEEINQALTARLIAATRTVAAASAPNLFPIWDSIRYMLQTCKDLHAGEGLSKSALLAKVQGLRPGQTLILQVAQQNAAVLIYWGPSAEVTVETFEASPRSEDVLASQNTLVRRFPGAAIRILKDDFTQPSFQAALASFLEQASTECIDRFAAQTNKAGTFTRESRNTTDPALVTEMLMSLLQAYGSRSSPSIIQKRVRDEVYWKSGAKNPWRRSPFWLILRVGLMRHLRTIQGEELGTFNYKILLSLVLQSLIQDSIGKLDPAVLTLLSSKLARRLVKLDSLREQLTFDTKGASSFVLKALQQSFIQSLKNSNLSIAEEWGVFKESQKKRIPLIPLRADPRCTRLTLRHSLEYLQQVLTGPRPFSGQAMAFHQMPQLNPSHKAAIQFDRFADRYFELATLDEQMGPSSIITLARSVQAREEKCTELANTIIYNIRKMTGAYGTDPVDNSLMILGMMRLWVVMDQFATEVYPLLKDFHPGMQAESLNVLLLVHKEDFVSLRKIQAYLDRRVEDSINRANRTIFQDPAPGCFAEQYFDMSSASQQLNNCLTQIETAAESAKNAKRAEWQQIYDDYQNKQRLIAAASCVQKMCEGLGWVHDDQRCTKCYHKRYVKRLKIAVHEHPLPAKRAEMKAAIFELKGPQALKSYRDATWKVKRPSFPCGPPVIKKLTAVTHTRL